MYLQLQLMVEMVQHRVYIAPRQVPVSQQKLFGIKSCVCDVIWQVLEP